MTAIRTVRAAEGFYVQLTNAAGQDRRLSLQARGLVYYVLSLPPDAHLTAAMIEANVPNGREAVRSALRELQECGYYRRTKTSLGRGRWEWEQVISDAPMTEETELEAFHVTGTRHMKRPAETTASDGPLQNTYDGFSSDENPSDKSFKDVRAKDEDQILPPAAPSAEDGALFDAPAPPPPPPPPPPKPLTEAQMITKRAQKLTADYVQLVPMSRFPAVMAIVKRAITAGVVDPKTGDKVADWEDEEIAGALARIARERRPVTIDTLRYQLERGDGTEIREVEYDWR